jgi:hypothetical protein
LELHALLLRGFDEKLARDLERRRERLVLAAVDVARHVEQHAAVDEQLFGVMRDVEVRADPAAADPARIARRRRGVDTAEEKAVMPDVAERIDARRPVLPAPLLDLRGERKLAAVAEGAARALMGRIQCHGIGRVDAGDGRVLVPGMRKVEEPRILDRADEISCGKARGLRFGTGQGLRKGKTCGGGPCRFEEIATIDVRFVRHSSPPVV